MAARHGWLAAAVLICLLSGCEGKRPDPRTPAEYFREQQTATVTPYGRVVPGSVLEVDDRIEFGTEDGRRWRVGYGKRVDGTYDYGTPEPVGK